MTLLGHVKFWFIAGIFSFFLMSVITKPEEYYQAAQKDIDNVYLAYGQESGSEIVSNANSAYAMIFTNTVASKAVETMHNEPRKGAAFFGTEQKAAVQSNRILKTFKLQIYALFLRASIAARWLPVLAVLGAAAFVDGLVSRKIKIEGYGFTSPGVQARMAHVTVMLTGMSALLFYLPVNTPILWWPIATVIAVICIRFTASNIKQITT